MSDRRCGEGAAGGRRVPAWQVGTVADHGNLGAMACGVGEQPRRTLLLHGKAAAAAMKRHRKSQVPCGIRSVRLLGMHHLAPHFILQGT